MPAVRPATLRAEDLPAVATAGEMAAFERVDVRTLRAEMEAGRVPGAYRRGRSWRIVTEAYFAAITANRRTNSAHEGVCEQDFAGQTDGGKVLPMRGGDVR